jgi:hypothetical protein
VSTRKRAAGHAICRSHGNIRNWERAQWRAQEAREEAEVAAFLAFAEAEERRIAASVRQEVVP